MDDSDSVVDIHVNKVGPSGRPVAVVMASSSIPLEKISGAIQKAVTRNVDLRKKLGLVACAGCAASGIDLDIRHRYDHVLQINLNKIG